MITPFSSTVGHSREDFVKGYLDMGFDQKTAEAYTSVLLGAPEPEVAPDPVLPIEKAGEIALATGHEEFMAEVAKSLEAGVAFLKVGADDEGNPVISQPENVTVDFMVPDLEIDTPGAVFDPNIRLVDLGPEADMSLTAKRALVKVVNEVAARHTVLRGVAHGSERRGGALVTKAYVPGLAELRDDLVNELAKYAFRVTKAFDPTITLAYTDAEPSHVAFDVSIDKLTARIGGFRTDATIPAPAVEHVGLITKADDEKRFTLGPMYIPGQLDAHGDWATSDDLQKALWDFNRGEKTIALQHHPEVGAMGEAVEMMVVPWEMDVPMYKADGTSETVHFPANTPWLGVVWNEDVWPLVKKGLIRGYSIGGRANLLDVALPEAAE